MKINFNQPHLTGKEAHYMYEAVFAGKLSGNGKFTKACQAWFEQRYGFRKCLLTSSGTDALEMCAMLCSLKPGDEVIVPSYTFVSTALAFLREGATVVFADSMKRNPNLDAETLEALITPRTKVIVPVHYAGVACDMDAILAIAKKHNLLVVEDAAQAVDSYYKGRPLGSIGQNDERFVRRAEIIWEKGTNRAEFFRGEVNKYGWVDMGSSFLPREVNAAFLWAQLENIDDIQAKRKALWNRYFERLKPLSEQGRFTLPDIPEYATNNAHMFYLVLPTLEARTGLLAYLKEHEVYAVFHYLSLHSSEYYKNRHDGRALPECDRYADCLVRLPLFYDLKIEDVERICDLIEAYYR